jgi:hypothetical protein
MGKCSLAIADGEKKILNYVCQFSFTKKISQKEFKSSNSPFACLWQEKDYQRGKAPILLPFVEGGGEGLSLFQKAKFIQLCLF